MNGREILRERIHPLHQLRKIGPVRWTLALADVPVWGRIRHIDFPVRIRVVRHASYVLLPRPPEPSVAAALLALRRVFEPSTFCDVGANFGYYSWLLRSADRSIGCVLLEPEPLNLDLIRATISRNVLRDVDVVGAAASDSAGVAAFHGDPVSGATGTLGEHGSFASSRWRASDAQYEIATVTLDELLGDCGAQLVKIDVEGHERSVFAGSKRLLQTHRPAIVFESTLDRDAVLALLAASDYRVASAERGVEVAEAANLIALPEESNYRSFVACWDEELLRL